MPRIWPWIGFIPLLGMAIVRWRQQITLNERNRRLLVCIGSLTLMLLLRSIDPFCEWLMHWQVCAVAEHISALALMIGCWSLGFSWCCLADAFSKSTTKTTSTVSSTASSIYRGIRLAAILSSVVAILLLCLVRQQWAKQVLTGNQSLWLMVMLVWISVWIVPILKGLNTHIRNLQQQQPTLIAPVVLGRNRILRLFCCIVGGGQLAVYTRLSQTLECTERACATQIYQLDPSPANVTLLYIQALFTLVFIYALTMQRNTPASPMSQPTDQHSAHSTHSTHSAHIVV